MSNVERDAVAAVVCRILEQRHPGYRAFLIENDSGTHPSPAGASDSSTATSRDTSGKDGGDIA